MSFDHTLCDLEIWETVWTEPTPGDILIRFFGYTDKTDRVRSVDGNVGMGRKDLIVLEAKILGGIAWWRTRRILCIKIKAETRSTVSGRFG